MGIILPTPAYLPVYISVTDPFMPCARYWACPTCWNGSLIHVCIIDCLYLQDTGPFWLQIISKPFPHVWNGLLLHGKYMCIWPVSTPTIWPCWEYRYYMGRIERAVKARSFTGAYLSVVAHTTRAHSAYKCCMWCVQHACTGCSVHR